MSFLDYSDIALEKFRFLIKDYGFEVTEVRHTNYGTFFIYTQESKKL